MNSSGRLTRRQSLAAAGLAAAGVALVPDLSRATPVPAHHRSARFQSDPSTLTLAVATSPANLDPHFAGDITSILVIQGIYEGLLALDGGKTDRYVGLMAETWDSNDDHSIWTFHLREGVTFHDGSPCDASAVVESFKRELTIGLGSNSTRVIPGPDAVSAPDARTVVFALGRPQPRFEAVMAGTYGVYVANTAVFDANEVDGDGGFGWAQTNAVGTGTGPYRLAEFVPDQQLVLERNPDYWGGWEGDHFERIVIRIVPEDATRRQLLERHEVDIVQTLTFEAVRDFAKNPEFTVTTAYSTRVDYFYLTVAGALSNPVARQALNWAFPYQEVIEGVFLGYAKPARGICAEALRGFDPETFSYTTDLEKARTLLREAGIPEGAALEIALVSGNENTHAIAQLFQANLDQIGVAATITRIDNASYVGLLYGGTPAEERPNLMYWAWWPLYNDAWTHLYDLVTKQAQSALGGNFGFYVNPEVEELMSLAANEADEAIYLELLASVQMIVNRDDPPAIYYAQPQQVVVTGSDIAGVVLNPINVSTFYFYQLSRRPI